MQFLTRTGAIQFLKTTGHSFVEQATFRLPARSQSAKGAIYHAGRSRRRKRREDLALFFWARYQECDDDDREIKPPEQDLTP